MKVTWPITWSVNGIYRILSVHEHTALLAQRFTKQRFEIDLSKSLPDYDSEKCYVVGDLTLLHNFSESKLSKAHTEILFEVLSGMVCNEVVQTQVASFVINREGGGICLVSALHLPKVLHSGHVDMEWVQRPLDMLLQCTCVALAGALQDRVLVDPLR